ncbi:MAG TPA: hypothetical protein VD861_21175, partial [Pyrinomonadaceae bacterium]|nr:hypothetical protein [Pyrinomonadaceae bacterium]
LLNGSLAARFEPNAIRLHTAAGERAAAVGLVFEGASPRAQVSGEGEQAGRYNFFVGNDPARWRSGVPAFGGVLYRGLYRDIDLRVRESAGVLEYDLLLAAGADLSKVAVRADGAARLEVAADGSLLIHTSHGPLRQTPPTTWEELPNGERRPVVCRFRQIDARRYGFTVEGRDHSLPLVIDPGLEWATYLGGGGHEVIRDMAAARDGSGDIVLVGSTSSLDFPATGGSFNANGQASFVARLSASGSGVVYATLFGGSGATGNDFAAAVALDAQGAPVVVGNTGSNDFPVTAGSYDGSYNGGGDAFVARFDAAGSRLVFSTFLGGAKDDPSSRFYSSSGYDEATAVGFDPAGSIIVAGYTTASTFPATAGAYDTTPAPFSDATTASMQDGFVARLNADGSQLTYSTYLGGQAVDTFHDLAVDAGGVVSLVGYTVPLSNRDADGNELPLGTAFPATAGAYDTTYNGNGDAVLVRLNPAGGGASDLQYSTFLGGNDTDEAWAVALDPNDHTSVAVIGETFSGNFPVTASAFGKTHFMPGDATMVTVSRFRFPAAGGGSLAWSTYYGGPGFQSADDGFVDETGAVVVVGSNSTSSPPTTERAFDRTPEVSDGFVARVSADGTQLLYSTLLGGSSFEGNLRAVGLGNNAVAVAGQTKSIDFPVTPGAYDTIYSTSGSPSEFNVYDTFIARLTLAPVETGDVTAAAPSLVAPAASATFTAPAVVNFDWADADDTSGVEAYHIQVSPNAAFTDGNNARTSGWFEKWVPASEVSTDFSQSFVGTFYWRVQTLDRAHNLSAWSEVRTFTVGAPVPPAAPNLVYLPNSARVPPARSITFMWDAVGGATSYEIQIDDSSGFRAPLIAGRGGLTTPQFAQTFARETSYWWRVRAFNAASAGPWSATRTFQVRRGASVPPPPTGAVTLSSLALNPSSLTGG